MDLSIWKVFADEKIKMAKNLKFAYEGVEKNVGKGENAGYQHFVLFPQCSQRSYFLGVI